MLVRMSTTPATLQPAPAEKPAGPWTPETVEFTISLAADQRLSTDEDPPYPWWTWTHTTPVFSLNVMGYPNDTTLPDSEWAYVIEVAGPPHPEGGDRHRWLGPFHQLRGDVAEVYPLVADLLNHGLTHATHQGWGR